MSQVLRTFGRGRGSGAFQLDGPWDFAVDCDERIVVVEMDNHRVILLDRDLTLLRVLLTKDDDNIVGPRRCWFIPETKTLLIGLNGNVNVYDLSSV